MVSRRLRAASLMAAAATIATTAVQSQVALGQTTPVADASSVPAQYQLAGYLPQPHCCPDGLVPRSRPFGALRAGCGKRSSEHE